MARTPPRTASPARTISTATPRRRSRRCARGYRAFAGQRDDGFYGDIQAIFDLLTLRRPDKAQDAQGGFNVHTMVLEIPCRRARRRDAAGRASMRRPAGRASRCCATPTTRSPSATTSRSDARATRCSARASSRSRTRIATTASAPRPTRPCSAPTRSNPELAVLINLLVLGSPDREQPDPDDEPHRPRGDLHPRSDQGRPVHAGGAPGRWLGGPTRTMPASRA